MALVVEDGTIVAVANTYVTVAELDSFAALRGVTLPATEPEKEVLIIKAADYIESFRDRFQGSKVSQSQPMQWPRYDVTIDGFEIASDEIPQDLKTAQLQAAIEVNAGADLQEPTGKAIKREKVDVIEVEYEAGGSTVAQSFPAVDASLDALLSNAGGQRFVMGYR